MNGKIIILVVTSTASFLHFSGSCTPLALLPFSVYCYLSFVRIQSPLDCSTTTQVLYKMYHQSEWHMDREIL